MTITKCTLDYFLSLGNTRDNLIPRRRVIWVDQLMTGPPYCNKEQCPPSHFVPFSMHSIMERGQQMSEAGVWDSYNSYMTQYIKKGQNVVADELKYIPNLIYI